VDFAFVIGHCATCLSLPWTSGSAIGRLHPGDRAFRWHYILAYHLTLGLRWHYILAYHLTLGLRWHHILAYLLTLGLALALHHCLPPGHRACTGSTSLPLTRRSGSLHYITALFLVLGLAGAWHYILDFDLTIGPQHCVQSTTSFAFEETDFLLAGCSHDGATHRLWCSSPSRVQKGNTARMGSRRSQLSTSSLL